MGGVTAEQVAQRAFDLGLVDDRQLQQVWAEFGSRHVSADDFLQLMVRRELLTNYQVERLVKGDRSGFFYGDYKVLYLVGAGTFARVFRAVHRETGQVVAVKVLRKRYSDNPSQYGQFVREGELGCTLRHPNIIPIYEVYSRGFVHYLVMEFVEGQNLREFVKVRRKLHPIEATRLMIDVASGLRYAFEHGLTHRDLKMTNVLISSQGRAKLADFGLAAIDDALLEDIFPEIPTNVRTIDYAALERATGVRKDDTRSDIYFLGCMYYHMLTGVSPLSESKDRVQRLNKTRFLDVVQIQKLNPAIPHSVALVVNKAMQLDVNRRYQTPAAVMVDLEIAARRLTEEGAAGGDLPADNRERDRLAARVGVTEPQGSVMIVESNARMQDLLRDGLKKAGYRVLITSDPQRAMGMFHQDPATADCLVFNAQEIGEPALEAFNQLGEDQRTHYVPALLLLDEPQREWRYRVNTADHRKLLFMPVTMGKLRAALEKLIPAGKAASQKGRS
jgi:serine/threonine protein kinase/CheY-like chemotaxis protein